MSRAIVKTSRTLPCLHPHGTSLYGYQQAGMLIQEAHLAGIEYELSFWKGGAKLSCALATISIYPTCASS
jgi:hypothetical protein